MQIKIRYTKKVKPVLNPFCLHFLEYSFFFTVTKITNRPIGTSKPITVKVNKENKRFSPVRSRQSPKTRTPRHNVASKGIIDMNTPLIMIINCLFVLF